MKRRNPFKIILIIIIFILITSCEQSSAIDVPELVLPDTTTAPAEGDPEARINTSVGLAFFAETINPLLSSNRINGDASRLMFDSLFKNDASFKPQPSLCKTYTLVDGVMILTLREGVTFSDKSPLTAADVVYSLNLVKSTVGSPYHSRLARVKTLTEKENGTIEIAANQPCGGLPAMLDIPIIKKETGITANAIGSGRYVFQTDVEGNFYLSENKAWWGKTSSMPVPRIELIPVPDYDAMLFSYETGDIDFINADTVGISSINLTGVSDMLRYNTTKIHYIGMNTRKTPLSDPAVRYKIAGLIDRETVCSQSLSGGVVPSAGFFHPVSVLHNLPVVVPAYEPVDLKKLFDGKTPIFLVNKENTYKTTAVEEIMKNLTAAGIGCEVRALEWDEFNRELKNGNFDFYYAEVKLSPDFNYSVLLASGGALNYGRFSDNEAADLLNMYLSADITQAKEAAAALNECLIRLSPVIPIGFQSDLFCIRSGLFSGVVPTASDIYDNFDRWERVQ